MIDGTTEVIVLGNLQFIQNVHLFQLKSGESDIGTVANVMFIGLQTKNYCPKSFGLFQMTHNDWTRADEQLCYNGEFVKPLIINFDFILSMTVILFVIRMKTSAFFLVRLRD